MELTKSSADDVLVMIGFNKKNNGNVSIHKILLLRGVADVKLNQ